MSHYINDEILETLYEEELDYFTKHNPCGIFTQDDIVNAAEIMAYKKIRGYVKCKQDVKQHLTF